MSPLETAERPHGVDPAADTDRALDALQAVEDRVRWLSAAIVDHANRVRPDPGGLKVGGHQASSASITTITTALCLDAVLPAERSAPLVTVLDGHPHTLAFLAGVQGVRATHLGVTGFGQSSDLAAAHALHGIDAVAIVEAALP